MLRGTVLGVETRTHGRRARRRFLTLASGATLRTLDLDQVEAVTLTDPALQAELAKALATLGARNDGGGRPVTIDFRGTGRRRVRIGYVVEAPVWKTSYRLLLGEDEGSGFVQGWAIVENQTEADWDGVRLALVTGQPISFIQNLYAPRYVQRPVVGPAGTSQPVEPAALRSGPAGSVDQWAGDRRVWRSGTRRKCRYRRHK